MNLTEFDQQIEDTNLMKGNTLYHLLGLISEVGECLESISVNGSIDDTHYYLARMLHDMTLLGTRAASYKRQMRDEGIEYQYMITDKPALQNEISDASWYVNSSADCVDMSSEDVAAYLKQKLQSRKERDMLRGSGDNR